MSRLIKAILAAAAISGLLAACDGGNGDGDTSPPPAATPNPCPTSPLQPSSESQVLAPQSLKTSGGLRDPDPRGTIFDVLWQHRSTTGSGAFAPFRTVTPSATEDVGDIAVIQDEGDLIAPPNTFDLRASGLRFVPRGGGGFNIIRIDSGFRAEIGDRVTLSDDDSVERAVAFGFPYYGQTQSIAFVNSDGNITFGEADRSSSDRNIARLLTGAPRVAAFLADLDPVGRRVGVRARRLRCIHCHLVRRARVRIDPADYAFRRRSCRTAPSR